MPAILRTMAYIGKKVAFAEGQSVGTGKFKGQCAALVQWFGGAPKTLQWKQGIRVKGNGDQIAPYTCIATFEDGVYPNRKHDNHAAIYLSQDGSGIEVYDQWAGKPIGKRRIRFHEGEGLDDPSNNGNCFYVID
jgi:hypothetical protein